MKNISKKLFGFLSKPLLVVCKVVGISGVKIIASALSLINRIAILFTGLWFIATLLVAFMTYTSPGDDSWVFWTSLGILIVFFLISNFIEYACMYLFEYLDRAYDSMTPNFSKEEPNAQSTPNEFTVHVVHHLADDSPKLKEIVNQEAIVEGEYTEHSK